MPDTNPDNFGTLFPGPKPPGGPPAEATREVAHGDTDPLTSAMASPPPPAAVEATMQWTGPSSFDGPLQNVPKQIIELGIVRKDQWEAAVKAVGNPLDIAGILRQLRLIPSHREIRGEKSLASLTEFQLQQILSGNIEKLRFQHHLILEKLGAGGMGEVYKVWNMNLQRAEAIKTVLSEYTTGATAGATHARDRFEREARVLAQLDHPCITTIYQFGREHGVDFLAMEYVRGQDMKSIVEEAKKSGESIPVWWAVERICAIAEALQHAHDMGIIHRDIKPSNIMITENEELKVLDMGIARLVNPGGSDAGTTRLTQAAVGLGTPEVMSPEQWADATAVTAESDIYSLGCTFFYVLTGQMPFRADNLNGLMFAHVNDPPPSLSSLRKDVPKELDAVVAKMLAKEPEDRFRSCRELLEALTPFCSPVESHRPSTKGSSKLPWAAAALAGILVLLGGFLLVPQFLREDVQTVPPPITTVEIDWHGRVEEEIRKSQLLHKDLWPKISSLENWLKAKQTKEVNSKKDFEALQAMIAQEAASRTKMREENLTYLAGVQSANQLVWENSETLQAQVEQEIDKSALADPAKHEQIKKTAERINQKQWTKYTENQLAKLQADNPEVWPTLERIQEDATNLADVDTPGELDSLTNALRQKAWKSKSETWAEQYWDTHKEIWPTASDLIAVMDDIMGDGTTLDETTFEKLKNAVQDETKKRINGWVDTKLREIQEKHQDGVWPDLLSLKEESEREFPVDSLDDDASLAKFTQNVQALTTALEHPFENLNLPSGGDPRTDNGVASLVKVYEKLIDAIASPEEPLAQITFDAYIKGNPTPVVPVTVVREGEKPETYDVKLESSSPGYVTLLANGEEGGLAASRVFLLQWTGELPANEMVTLSKPVATSPGTDRLHVYVTTQNPLDDCPPEGLPRVPQPHFGSLEKAVIHRFTTEREPPPRFISLNQVRQAFPFKLVWERIQHSIALSEPMPGYKPSGKIKLVGRKVIDVRAEKQD